MIKMTNADASRFLSPVMDKLFNDADRHFTITDAHMLMKAIEAVKTGMATYQKQAQSIMESHGAEQVENGMKFKTSEDAASASKDLNELNEIEVEFNIDPIKAKVSWPDLSMGELLCLRPILDMSEIIAE